MKPEEIIIQIIRRSNDMPAIKKIAPKTKQYGLGKDKTIEYMIKNELIRKEMDKKSLEIIKNSDDKTIFENIVNFNWNLGSVSKTVQYEINRRMNMTIAKMIDMIDMIPYRKNMQIQMANMGIKYAGASILERVKNNSDLAQRRENAFKRVITKMNKKEFSEFVSSRNCRESNITFEVKKHILDRYVSFVDIALKDIIVNPNNEEIRRSLAKIGIHLGIKVVERLNRNEIVQKLIRKHEIYLLNSTNYVDLNKNVSSKKWQKRFMSKEMKEEVLNRELTIIISAIKRMRTLPTIQNLTEFLKNDGYAMDRGKVSIFVNKYPRIRTTMDERKNDLLKDWSDLELLRHMEDNVHIQTRHLNPTQKKIHLERLDKILMRTLLLIPADTNPTNKTIGEYLEKQGFYINDNRIKERFFNNQTLSNAKKFRYEMWIEQNNRKTKNNMQEYSQETNSIIDKKEFFEKLKIWKSIQPKKIETINNQKNVSQLKTA